MAVLSWSTPCKVLQSSLSQSELWREEAVDFGAQFSKNKALKNRAQVVNKLSLMGLERSSLCRVSCLNNSLETKARALELRMNYVAANGEVVKAEEIAGAVRSLMDGEDTPGKRVKEMAEAARMARLHGGGD
ncbi:hypothetical protein Bca52824_040636 [Brassica carinata]|uniref:Uncharacterized protein n=1 Tax=Brassica carinata TaxID=52824 RepID=A0A8X7RTS8_BRACI|nr:hypothetical protein Bca52824_040636 [Brassica carinata]